VLRYLLHHTEKVAIAESLGIVCAIALVSVLPYARQNLVNWRAALLFGFSGMAGTFFGASGAKYVPGTAQLMLFAIVMLWAAILMWRQRPRSPSSTAEAPARRPVLKTAAEGFAVGALTGVVGVGGGFLIVPALVILGALDMRAAVGTSLVVIALQSAVGFWTHLHVLQSLNLGVDWGVVAAFVAVGIVGSLIGQQLNARVNQVALRRGFALLLVAMGVFILIRESMELVRVAA
jgi:uncharacterized membrane protein YfcA